MGANNKKKHKIKSKKVNNNVTLGNKPSNLKNEDTISRGLNPRYSKQVNNLDQQAID